MTQASCVVQMPQQVLDQTEVSLHARIPQSMTEPSTVCLGVPSQPRIANRVLACLASEAPCAFGSLPSVSTLAEAKRAKPPNSDTCETSLESKLAMASSGRTAYESNARHRQHRSSLPARPMSIAASSLPTSSGRHFTQTHSVRRSNPTLVPQKLRAQPSTQPGTLSPPGQ
jgi:hypothetical protein